MKYQYSIKIIQETENAPDRILIEVLDSNDYIRRSFVDPQSAFGNRVYQDMTELYYKIDSLAIEVDGVKQSNQRVEQKLEEVSTEMNGKLEEVSVEMNGKLDVILRHLTGMN